MICVICVLLDLLASLTPSPVSWSHFQILIFKFNFSDVYLKLYFLVGYTYTPH